MTLDWQSLAAVLTSVGVIATVLHSMAGMARHRRLRKRLTQSLDLQQKLPDDHTYRELNDALSNVAKHCASELALLEQAWLRRDHHWGFLRKERWSLLGLGGLCVVCVAAWFAWHMPPSWLEPERTHLISWLEAKPPPQPRWLGSPLTVEAKTNGERVAQVAYTCLLWLGLLVYAKSRQEPKSSPGGTAVSRSR